jgi:dCMP deaminase
MNRPSIHEIYMRNAENWALRSKALRKKTGAVIVKNGNRTCSDGYNGMPAGSTDDCCELKDENGEFILNDKGEMITNPLVLHAEANAILKLAAAGGEGSEGTTLYCTLSPCTECAKLILQAKIKTVYYRELYRIPDGIDILQRYGVECIHLLHEYHVDLIEELQSRSEAYAASSR